MQSAFGTVVMVVVALAALAALISFLNRGKLYDQIGRGGLSLGEDARAAGGPPQTPVPPASRVEQEAEIRQMLVARSERRVRRGGAPLDIDAELAVLVAPVVNDTGLVAEVRALVVARNHRRTRQGKPPLDVEQEVARQLRELSGS
jgi:hypothetical protein